MKKKISVAVLLATLFCTTSCTYNPPEGATRKHHSYAEILKYAQEIDENAVVDTQYTDTIYSDRLRDKYREWDAVINGVSCHVSSVPMLVWNEGFAGGEFCRDYFFISTDYDYYLLKNVVDTNYPAWTVYGMEVYERYPSGPHYNNWQYIKFADLKKEKLSYEELDALWDVACDIQAEYQETAIEKELRMELYIPIVYSTATGENKHIKIREAGYLIGDGLTEERYAKYAESWELIHSDLPIKD